jgi:hypothetical protein
MDLTQPARNKTEIMKAVSGHFGQAKHPDISSV